MSCIIPSALRFCHFNIGGVKDYYIQHGFLKPDSKIKQEELLSKYEIAQENIAKILCSSNPHDVYFLQEVIHKDRPLIRELIKTKFTLFHKNTYNGFDTVIALNGERFKDAQDFSIEVNVKQLKKEATIVVAKDLITEQSIAFVSAHAPGFDFESSNLEQETQFGDTYCQAIITKLNEIAKGCIQIIGVDMNANPEKWQKRFDIFLKEGFKLVRLNEATNLNPQCKEVQREIDYVLVKIESLLSKNQSFIFDDQSTTIKAALTWDLTNNPSDHLPLVGRFTFLKEMSFNEGKS